MKSTQPIADLAAQMVWPGEMPEALVRFIGISKFLGALGLILPFALRIKPSLTVAAAIGLVIVRLLAMAFNISRGEFLAWPINATMAGIAAFIAWGRSMKAPIASC